VVAALLALLVFSSNAVAAAPARFTCVVKDVSLVRQGAAGRAAVPNESIGSGAVVRTGTDARAELTFVDRAVMRLGGKTMVRLGEDLTLEEGALLFDAPRGASSATIRTGKINLEGAGATGIIERFGKTYAKVMLLEGTARVFLPQKVGESLLLKPGQILIMKPDAKTLADPVDFDIAQLYRTSLLVGHEFARLPSDAQIQAEIARQKSDPNLIPTNLVIRGRGTLVTLADPKTVSSKGNAKPTPTPTPRPSPKR
jgi:hypothetical protein